MLVLKNLILIVFKKKNLIIENQLIKDTLELIKVYFSNLNLLKSLEELSTLNSIDIKLPKLYNEEINIIPLLYEN